MGDVDIEAIEKLLKSLGFIYSALVKSTSRRKDDNGYTKIGMDTLPEEKSYTPSLSI